MNYLLLRLLVIIGHLDKLVFEFYGLDLLTSKHAQMLGAHVALFNAHDFTYEVCLVLVAALYYAFSNKLLSLHMPDFAEVLKQHLEYRPPRAQKV